MLDEVILSDELKDKNFLRACDLKAGVEGERIIYRKQVLTIADIKIEKITDMEKLKSKEKDTTKEAYVLHFAEKGYKPYVVAAKTVIDAIVAATGTKIVNNWIGHKIEFYVEKNVKAFGKVTDALRVTPYPVVIEMAKCECCGKEIPKTTFDGTKKKCGFGVCSAECRDKLKGGTSDETNHD